MYGNAVSSVRGKAGEDAVCDYLEAKGYKIVKRNYRRTHGEIDIIADNDEYIAFVEVKTRKKNAFSAGYEAMTKAKMKHILSATDEYLYEFGTDKQPRFDTAYVTVTDEKIPSVLEIEYYENDFDATSVQSKR